MNFRQLMQDGLVIFDGAFGSLLQEKGLQAGELPEGYNLTHPQLVTEIHRDYVRAGSQVITTNTFGANAHKLEGSGYSVEQVVTAAVQCAKRAGAPFVALDLGPTGQMMEPIGNLTFEQAVALYKQQIAAGVAAGVDVLVIETIADLYEAKAAIIAAKETTDLPILCTLTFQQDGRTFVGTDAQTAVVVLTGLGVDALGVNCSMGPRGLMPIVEEMLTYATVPVVVQANAGLPREVDGQTVFDVTPQEYAACMTELYQKGVRVLGGCCGTTPAHIGAVAAALQGRRPVEMAPRLVTACASPTKTVVLDGNTTVIGERINPTGKKMLKEALRNQQWSYLIGEAVAQTKAGSHVLDVNCGLPEIDEVAMLTQAVCEIQAVTTLPLQIDSTDPVAIQAAVRKYNGKPIINSVNGSSATMAEIFPIAKKYGALVIGLTLDEQGIPATAQGRLEIARRILEQGLAHGIPKQDIIIDCLVLTASAQQAEVAETLKAIRLVQENLGLKTVLGVSNVSFGLPGREMLNSTFLAAALGVGLDCAIINPMSQSMMQVVDCFRVLSNQDVDSVDFVAKYGNAGTAATTPALAPMAGAQASLQELIVDGKKEEVVRKTAELLQTVKPLDLIEQHFVPALDFVGDGFEKGRLFLPQLMQSAESVKAGVALVKEALDRTGQQMERKKVIVATVKGDVHDIGKNIAKMLLENYGYQVIDLGKDVAIEAVVEAAMQHQVQLIGLSALMTTTVKSMKQTIDALKQAGCPAKVMVGGAVLNEEYAKDVGADYYVKDARDGVKVAAMVFGD